MHFHELHFVGRKKFSRTVSTAENINLNDSKRKDAKPTKKFKGKLSHSSPLSHSVGITRYFQPDSSLLPLKEKENINATANSVLDDRTPLKDLTVDGGETCKGI